MTQGGLPSWQTDTSVEPEVSQLVEEMCIAVCMMVPVSDSFAIIREMEQFQRALWETEALREAKERRLKMERRQRAKLKLERSRQELEERVRRRQEARAGDRAGRAAAPMVVVRRKQAGDGGGGGNPNSHSDSTASLAAHREGGAAAAAARQSRLPFTNAQAGGGGAAQSGPMGILPPSRERNVATTVDLAGSLDQSFATLRAQALAMAQDAGFTPSEMAEVLPEMDLNGGSGGQGSARGGWPPNAEPNQQRLSAALQRLQAAQRDLGVSQNLTPDQLRQQQLLEVRSRGRVFARNSEATLTPRGGGLTVESRDNSGGRSGREGLMENGLHDPLDDSGGTRRSGAMMGAGARSRGGRNGGLRGSGRFKGGPGARGARGGSTNKAAGGSREMGEYGLTSTAYLNNGNGTETGVAGGSMTPPQQPGQTGRELLQQQAQRSQGQLDRRQQQLASGFAPGSGREYNGAQEPVWKTDAEKSPVDLYPPETTTATMSVEAQKREELWRIQQENNRLRQDLADGTDDAALAAPGAEALMQRAGAGKNGGSSPGVSPQPESITGSPFYQFKVSPADPDGGGSPGLGVRLRSDPGSAPQSRQGEARPDGNDGSVSARRASADSDDGDSDAEEEAQRWGSSNGPLNSSGVAVGRIRPGNDVASVRGTRGRAIQHQMLAKSAVGGPVSDGSMPEKKKPQTAEEVRASTRGNWHGILGLMATKGKGIGVSGNGLTQGGADAEQEDRPAAGADGEDDETARERRRYEDDRAKLDTHSHVQKRLGDIHSMVLDTVRWEKKKERRAEARDDRKSTFRSATLDVAARAFERDRPDLLFSSQFR